MRQNRTNYRVLSTDYLVESIRWYFGFVKSQASNTAEELALPAALHTTAALLIYYTYQIKTSTKIRQRRYVYINERLTVRLLDTLRRSTFEILFKEQHSMITSKRKSKRIVRKWRVKWIGLPCFLDPYNIP